MESKKARHHFLKMRFKEKFVWSLSPMLLLKMSLFRCYSLLVTQWIPTKLKEKKEEKRTSLLGIETHSLFPGKNCWWRTRYRNTSICQHSAATIRIKAAPIEIHKTTTFTSNNGKNTGNTIMFAPFWPILSSSHRNSLDSTRVIVLRSAAFLQASQTICISYNEKKKPLHWLNLD